MLGPTWFSIGERKAGETVRVALDAKNGLRQFSLYSSDGTKTGGTMVSEDATLSIPSNGTYFLFVEASAFDANDRETAFRIRFDAGAVTPYQNSVKGPDSLTLALGASVYLDTQLLPVDAAGGDYSSRSVTIDDSNIVSSAGNGYLTAVAVGKTNVHGCYSPYDDTMVKEIPVTVIAPTKLTVTGGEGDTLLPGQTRQLTAVLEPAGLLGGAACGTHSRPDALTTGLPKKRISTFLATGSPTPRFDYIFASRKGQRTRNARKSMWKPNRTDPANGGAIGPDMVHFYANNFQFIQNRKL